MREKITLNRLSLKISIYGFKLVNYEPLEVRLNNDDVFVSAVFGGYNVVILKSQIGEVLNDSAEEFWKTTVAEIFCYLPYEASSKTICEKTIEIVKKADEMFSKVLKNAETSNDVYKLTKTVNPYCDVLYALYQNFLLFKNDVINLQTKKIHDLEKHISTTS